MATKKEFHIGDVLSITTNLLISTKQMEGFYDILEFMAGERPFTQQVPRVCDECRPHLLKQFPQLDSPEMQFAVAELKEMLKTPSGKSEPESLIIGWLFKLTSGQYGIQVQETLEVETLPRGKHLPIDSTEEAKAMFGDDNVVVIDMD